jgi:hypothetical protein
MSAGRAIPRSVRFIAMWLHVKFVMDEVALNRLLSNVSWLSPNTDIPPLLHPHLSTSPELYDSPVQAAHYHIHGLLVRG